MTGTQLAEIVEKVSNALGRYAVVNDPLVTPRVQEVADFLVKGGVPESYLSSDAVIGVLAIGVNDLLNYQGGAVQLSPYFYQRAAQLALTGEEEGE